MYDTSIGEPTLKNQIKSLLTKLGRYSSPNIIHGLNATANYIALGRWFKDNHFDIGVTVKHRGEVFDLAAPALANVPVLYLEFGVWKGEATRYWSKLLKHPGSILHGFDSFEGLPEDWNHATGKAHFSTDGQIPNIDDKRVQFFKGWFDQILPKYKIPAHTHLFINMDADLYSSTKTVLDFLKDEIKVGTYIYFDEFNDRFHEMKAFDEFLKETKMKFKVVGANQILSNVLFQRIG